MLLDIESIGGCSNIYRWEGCPAQPKYEHIYIIASLFCVEGEAQDGGEGLKMGLKLLSFA